MLYAPKNLARVYTDNLSHTLLKFNTCTYVTYRQINTDKKSLKIKTTSRNKILIKKFLKKIINFFDTLATDRLMKSLHRLTLATKNFIPYQPPTFKCPHVPHVTSQPPYTSIPFYIGSTDEKAGIKFYGKNFKQGNVAYVYNMFLTPKRTLI